MGPQVNKFEQVSSDDQMFLVGALCLIYPGGVGFGGSHV